MVNIDEDLTPENLKAALESGKGLEYFVMLAVTVAKKERASDSQILERVRKEALSSLIACT